MAGKDYRNNYEPCYGTAKPDPNYPDGYNLKLLIEKEEIEEVVNSIPEKSFVGFDVETNGLSHLHHKLVGFSFAWTPTDAYYIPMRHMIGKNASIEVAEAAIRKICTNPLLIFNAKFDLRFASVVGVDLLKVKFLDMMALIWLMDSNIHSPNLKEYVMRRVLGWDGSTYDEVFGKDADMSFSNPADPAVLKYVGFDALGLVRFYHGVHKFVKTFKFCLELDSELVRPVMFIEDNAHPINTQHLRDMQRNVTKRIKDAERAIYDSVGYVFAITSNQQMGHIL